MPVITTRIQPGIYHNEWNGVVDINDVFDAKDTLEAMAREDGYEFCIAIICPQDVTKYPVGLRDLNRTVPKHVQELVIYGVSPIANFILRSFKHFSPVPIMVFKTRDEAIAHAQTQLPQLA